MNYIIELRVQVDERFKLDREGVLELGESLKDALYSAEPEVKDVTYEVKEGEAIDSSK